MADARARQRHGKHHVTCYDNDVTIGVAMFPCYISELQSREQFRSLSSGSEGVPAVKQSVPQSSELQRERESPQNTEMIVDGQ
jgi:hypothetical protein